jgi:hypothetical protein
MTDAPLFSYRVKVDDIPEKGLVVDVEVPQAERLAIAKAFGLIDVGLLKAAVTFKRKGKEASASGMLDAQVTQTCVVTLDPFDETVHEPLNVQFAPDAPALDDETAPLDAPDPIINGEIEWGGLMVEFLALALDPYPRKPGAEFQFETQGEAEHPFAALKKWTKE